MPARKNDQGYDCPQQRQKHVPLRIPDVSLGAQELITQIRRDEDRHPPLDEFVERADS